VWIADGFLVGQKNYGAECRSFKPTCGINIAEVGSDPMAGHREVGSGDDPKSFRLGSCSAVFLWIVRDSP
jgi:hypothetical protein